MKFVPLTTRLETILSRRLDQNLKKTHLVGSTSTTALALFLSQAESKQINGLPHLIVVSSSADAARLQNAIGFFDSGRRSEVLPHFDVSPYSGLYPKTQAVADRMRFLYRAQNARPGEIFIASVGSLMQKCLPFAELVAHTYHLRVDGEIPEHFHDRLAEIGYQASPLVEDLGQVSQRGGILDIFSPGASAPVRIELFGDTIVSMRFFSPENQSSGESLQSISIIPCRETLWLEKNQDQLLTRFRSSVMGREVPKADAEEALRSLSRQASIDGMDFLLPYFFPKLDSPLEFFSTPLNIWLVDPDMIQHHADQLMQEMQNDFQSSASQLVRPEIDSLFIGYDAIAWPEESNWVDLTSLHDEKYAPESIIEYRSFPVSDLSQILNSSTPGSEPWLGHLRTKLQQWHRDGYRVLVGVRNRAQAERLRLFLEKLEVQTVFHEPDDFSWGLWDLNPSAQAVVNIILRPLPEGVRIPEEQLVLLRDEDLFGKKVRQASATASDEFQKQARRLSFGDLKPGDCVVHTKHGIGIYEGLRVMDIGGAQSEFMQIQYKGNDKLYLPVYKVGQLQKFSGPTSTSVLDKLGGPGWEKTKIKVKSHLRDIASELLALYAKRSEITRPAFHLDDEKYSTFANAFPYDETDDQLRAIDDVLRDLQSPKPMDRLICGDVGYGKTEVAMRAAFVAASEGRQVAILAPTTVLSFQHFENFKKRFAGLPVQIRELNRFVDAADVKKSLLELRDGKVDIIIGTHRLLSKDVQFKDLGLLVIDEEQKFGVTHKEKIKKLKTSVDTLTMSATPIPRTLNMSLVGVRDLSLINTAPVDRLPTRTFISKWDDETIRKSIESEIRRGGQIFFIHNRVQSIFSVAEELRRIVPEARIRIGHGQMDEDELEKTMVQFFNHEIDVLLCTTIVESGMDVPRANTMFIDQAQNLGLSQLYQLRGRVGRSKQRAYCYLLLPRGKLLDKMAQERLKVLQENTALGSGIRIAQYDLELRGMGNLLGEEQSGHINTVGYELYMDLLNEAIHELRNEPIEDQSIDPEINLRIPALIPDTYISDIRLRLSFYKALADVRSTEDMEKIESELRDQFGEPPEPAQNLMGLMLIRSQCKSLGIRDLSAGPKTISLLFTEKTPLSTEVIIKLATRENKKYSITPGNRLNVRMNNISWPAVFEELRYLTQLAKVN